MLPMLMPRHIPRTLGYERRVVEGLIIEFASVFILSKFDGGNEESMLRHEQSSTSRFPKGPQGKGGLPLVERMDIKSLC